jgi:hypothetical protein
MMFQNRWLAASLSALFLVGSAASLCAQSLADLAKKEEARRQAIKEPAKSYTNKDLVSVPPATATPASDAAKPATPAGDAAGAAKDKDKKDKDKPDAEKDKDAAPKGQKYWAGRRKDLQEQLDKDQVLADALQSRVDALTRDFTARDNPAERAQIGNDRQRALDTLTNLKQAIQADKKAIVNLEEEARRAGVPAGWLRS